MSIIAPGQNLEIPTVTLHDLRAFHANHFVEPHPSLQPIAPAVDEEATSLGYYPDGVERTLTDDQIAIFRHSEIQKLLRARQLREEFESEELEVVRIFQEPVVEDEKASVDLVEHSRSDGKPVTEITMLEPPNKKRKRAKNGQEWTPRRMAREQDELQVEDVELEY